MLQLRHMLCCRSFLRKIPWQHELRFEDRPRLLHAAIKGCRHPTVYRMKKLLLHVGDDLTCVLLVPVPVQWFGHRAELARDQGRIGQR